MVIHGLTLGQNLPLPGDTAVPPTGPERGFLTTSSSVYKRRQP